MKIIDALHLLKAIADSKTRLTNFEKDFCRSIVKSCALGKRISDKQGDVLQMIYRRCFGGSVYQRKEYIA